jgi:hypothetical protein
MDKARDELEAVLALRRAEHAETGALDVMQIAGALCSASRCRLYVLLSDAAFCCSRRVDFVGGPCYFP